MYHLLLAMPLVLAQTDADSARAAIAIARASRPTVSTWQALEKKMERYESAKYTQMVFTSNGRPALWRMRRAFAEKRWRTPGGLLNAKGWKSELFRFLPRPARVWRAKIAVLNSYGDFQDEMGLKREYADGTFFMDVLSYKGRVFERRIREKKGGAWENYVAYKDIEARPPGYERLNQSCASCHQQAGTGGYADGLVPGGDETLSDPFQELEQ